MEDKTAINERTIWNRGLYMLLFAVLFSVARIVGYAVVILQFLFVLFSGSTNQRLLIFGNELSRYIYQIMQYLTFNSEERPYPFSEWPDETSESGAE